MLGRILSLIHYSPIIMSGVSMTFHLTLEEEKKLKEFLKEKTLSWQVRKRLEALRLLANGLTPNLVAKQLAIRSQLVYEYARTFKTSGFVGIIRMDKPGKETKLTEAILEELEQVIALQQKKGRKVTREENVAWLLDHYNIDISPEWLSQRLATRARAKDEEPWR